MKIRRIKVIFIAVILAFGSMAVGFVPISVQAVSENTVKKEVMPAPATDEVTPEKATIKYSGVDGDLSWSIDTDGLLTITGTGDYTNDYIEGPFTINGIEYDSLYGPEWIEYYSEIKTAKVSVTDINDMNYMFNGCSALTSVDVSGLDTSGVTSMNGLFSLCCGISSLDVSGFNTSSVTDMSCMFDGCSGLTSLDVSGFDTSIVNDMSRMFECCNGLTSLDVSGFDTSSVTNMENMLDFCSALTRIYAPNNQSSCIMVLPKTEHSWLYQSTGEVVTAITNAGTYVRSDSLMPEEKGTKITDSKSKGNYRVTNANASAPTVEYVGTTTPQKAKVTIPEYVTYKNIKYKVTSVAAKAFKGNKKLKNISIATSITTIGKDSFNGCTNLKTVTVGKSLRTIGNNAFKNCKKLTKVDIKSKRLETIGSGAFYKCSALTNLTFNSTKLKSIGKNAFKSCKKLTKIIIKSKKLKTVGKNALKGVNKKCVIKVPKAKVKAYTKLFAKKGQAKTVKVTK